MVRGLDYYRRTTFEFVISGMGAQNTVAAGGRYDGLAQLLGGKERVPAIGFAIGVERLLMLLGEGGGRIPRGGRVSRHHVSGAPPGGVPPEDGARGGGCPRRHGLRGA